MEVKLYFVLCSKLIVFACFLDFFSSGNKCVFLSHHLYIYMRVCVRLCMGYLFVFSFLSFYVFTFFFVTFFFQCNNGLGITYLWIENCIIPLPLMIRLCHFICYVMTIYKYVVVFFSLSLSMLYQKSYIIAIVSFVLPGSRPYFEHF